MSAGGKKLLMAKSKIAPAKGSTLKVELEKDTHYTLSGNRLPHHDWSRSRTQVDQLTEDDKLGVAATNQPFMLGLSLAAAFQEHR